MRQELGDPLGVFDGGLAARDRLDVRCIEQPDRAGTFKQMEDWLPVLPYSPVLSRPTWVQPPSASQSERRKRSPVVVPNVCVSARRAPYAPRRRVQTTQIL